MAVPGTIQALIAAFSFGILFNAASAALVLYAKGYGSAIYRDGPRLVLVLFLLTSSSWALVEFLATLIDPRATSTCQVAVIFSSLFDQLGRVLVEQYLVWAVPKGDTKTAFALVPQILVFGRFFVGVAFTAVSRVQFKPTCVPISSIRAVSITTIALDAVIIGLLFAQAFSNGSVGKDSGLRSVTLGTKTARLVVVGVAVWLGTSVTLLLGLQSLDLFYRTALPGIGLTILVALLTILSQTLITPRELPQRPDSPISRDARDLSSSDSTDYPPSRYEELKVPNIVTISNIAAKNETSRVVRRNDDGTFPAISKPMVVELDMSGNPIQGQPFPVIKPSTLAPAIPAVPPLSENWGIFKIAGGRKKEISKPRAKTGKLVISNPVPHEDENMQKSLKKIHMIGLAEAANNDKLRREKYAQRVPNLIAQRPAPRPPSPLTAPSAPDPVTTEAQVTGNLERPESSKTNETSSGLSVVGNASSTATQLSPGADVLRRRSPRQPDLVTLTTPFKLIRPGEPIRIPIPRPQETQNTPPPPKPEPVKTPLQRRPTTGLPSNPRAQGLKLIAKEASNQKTQTVMFINNIVYNNPDAVGDIIQGATKAPQRPDSDESVVHRPRPIPRKSDKDRQVFPAELSPNHKHKRSKSSGSIVSRKSILQSAAGSPTGLPSLPPVPPLTSMTTRAAPRSAKSMTVEEKMALLYPAPLSAPSDTELGRKRSSSVPTLPPIPDAFQQEHSQPLIDDPSDTESNNDMRASKASKRTTTRTSSLLEIVMDERAVSQSGDLVASFGDGNPAAEPGNSWLPGVSLDASDGFTGVAGEAKRMSSPVLPAGRLLSMSTVRSEPRSGDEEIMANWGSVHSPVAPVLRQNAHSTYIRKGPRNSPSSNSEDVPFVMFAESPEDVGSNGPSRDSESSKSPANDSEASQRFSGQFHHRVGDDCPTFSARKDKSRPRKMPPPTPLLLNKQSPKHTVVKAPAPPSPVESPRAAYEVIQAQLRKFEQLAQEPVDSPSRRLALLANLEEEMGQLESEWQSNHDHLSRDSMASIQMSPTQSRPASVATTILKPSSQRSSVSSALAERRASRRARMQSRGSKEMPISSSQSSSKRTDNTRDGASQARSPETHNRFAENASGLHAQSKPLSLLSLSAEIYGESDLGMEESHSVASFPTAKSIVFTHGLWSHKAPNQDSPKAWLWDPEVSVREEPRGSSDLPGLSIRPATRRYFDQLTIESSRLWQYTSKLKSIKSHEGLWNNNPSWRPASTRTPTRPVTMRPPRKNKRVTLLPDIIENPEPLPDKRGTLGIFQFPWGEKSEHATLQYRPSQVLMAMPGTMTTGRPMVSPVADSGTAQLEATEYSSSFFDEYDEEEGDNFSDFSDSGDDDFDETTLWEIASLLQTDNIPSKNSLLPAPLQFSPLADISSPAEFATDLPSDDEHGNNNLTEIYSSPQYAVEFEQQKVSDEIVGSSLWTPQYRANDYPQEFGLPQHEGLEWHEHITEPINRARAWPQTNGIERIHSRKLWSPAEQEKGSREESFLWDASKETSIPEEALYSVQAVQSRDQPPRLWVRPGAIAGSTTLGLLEPKAEVWQKLVIQSSIVNRPRSRPERPLPNISSNNLWSQGRESHATMLWSRPVLSPEPDNEGLFRLGDSRVNYSTTPNLPAEIVHRKRAFQSITPLDPIESTALWGLKAPTPIKLSTTVLWTREVDNLRMATSESMQGSKAADLSSGGLWQRPVQALTPPTLGLFDLETVRHDFRRTSELPAATTPSSRPRYAKEQTLALTSRNLWTSQQVRTTTVRNENVGLLWQEKLSIITRTPTLFTLDAGRTDYRTTSADPAAMVMVREPRTIQQPLQRLQSTQLWTNTQVADVKLDWITMCTAQPSSLAARQLPSANSSSVEASVATDLAPEAPNKSKGGFFSNWFSKKTNKHSATTVVPKTDETAERGPSTRTQLNVTSSTHDLAELLPGIVVKNLDDIPPAKPAHTALRHLYRHTIAYKADWDGALAEALGASYPGTMPALRTYSPQDWDAQLHEAIIAGRVASRASRQQTTPRDWSVALHQAVLESYPELKYSRGQTLAYRRTTGLQEHLDTPQSSHFDAATRHPAFFGSLKTSAEVVHPALTGYRFSSVAENSSTRHQDASVVRRAVPSKFCLWTPLESQATSMSALWTLHSAKNSSLDCIVSPSMRNHDSAGHYPMRGSMVAQSLVVEMDIAFEKQGLWKRGSAPSHLRHPSSFRKNWLEDTVNKRFTRIELRY
ncbi:hypothetical protein F4802DRAFT_411122 [Xylaria palmicola]|nr:hypothetical protein F4802DRAFT_411122 [Xylaria palmicola]